MKISNRKLMTVGAIYIVASIIIVALVSYEMRQQAHIEAESKALILLNRNLATHNYFSRELKPIILSWSAPFRSPDYFEPTWMAPTYAVRRIDHYFKLLEKSEYYYKEFAINARSPENEADPEERAFLEQLNKDPKLIKRTEVRTMNGQPFFVVMRRGEQMVASCLRCHSTHERAPGHVVKTYGPTRSFGRRVGEAVHAISIRIPLAEAYGKANRLSWHLSGIMFALLGCLFVSQTLISKRWLFDPMATIRHKGLEIAESETRLGETIPVPAGRELQDLTTAFNTMSANLRQSHDSLEERVRQRTAELNQVNERLEQDIRKRQRVEESLRETTEAFQALIQASPLAIFVLDPAGRVQLWNEAAERIFGWTAGEAVGQVLPIVPEDKMSEFRGLLQRALEGEPLAGVEVRRRKKDGRPIDVRAYSATLYDSQGQVTGLMAVVADNTLQKQAEATLRESERKHRAIIETAMDGFLLVDLAGRFLEVYDAYCRMTGYSRAELLRMDIAQVEAMESLFQVEEHIKKVIDDHGDFFETIHRRKDGSTFPMEVSVNYLPLEKGRIFCFLRDITARQQAQEALRESEERFRSLFDNIDLGITLINPDYRIKMINPGQERFFHKPAREFIDKECFREFEKRVIVCPHCPGTIAMATGRKAEVETRGVLDDGSHVPVRIQAFPYFDARGEITGFIEVVEDITPRREAEKELKQIQEALAEEAIRRRILVEQSRDGMVVLDQSGKVYEANQKYAEMLGYSAEEVRELYVWDWDAQWTREELLEQIRLIDATGDHFETRHRRKDGTFLDVEISTNGAVLGGRKLVFCVCRDISQRKAAERALRESEEKYRLVFEKAPLGILHYDQTSTITDSNEMFAEIIGAPKEKFIGFHMIRQLQDEKMREAVAASLKGEVGYYESEYLSVTAGKLTPVRAIFQPLFSLNGVIAGGVGIFEDITERQKAEAERLHFNKLESLATLAGGIAHDFNNILTAIMGNISLARLDQYEGQRLADAEDACLQAKALALQLLTFAKGGDPIKELISVARLVTETGAFACRGTNVRCEFSLPENLWVVNADPNQLGQVSHNLVINAIQAMPTGGVIKIQGENLLVEAGNDLPLDPGKYIKISLQDQGLGIPAEYLPRIFDPYFTTKQTGSGLGLATAYSIIKAHQGHITVESTLGKGTTFHLYLPAAEQKIAEQIIADKKVIKGDGRILVMDDEEMVQEILNKMLGYLGYKAMFAGNGHEAIELFTRAQESGEAFDAVILDLTVPGGMGGQAAMEKLLQIDPQVKAIVSSGYSEDPIMAEFARYGFSGVIAKPYRISELSKVLDKVLSTEKGRFS